jgi:hypothetical protein
VDRRRICAAADKANINPRAARSAAPVENYAARLRNNFVEGVVKN